MYQLIILLILHCLITPSFQTDSLNEDALPHLAPYALNEKVDPFEKYEKSKRESIRSLFTPATFNPDCESFDKTIIKPIYYWPGETVKLQCTVCSGFFVNNGVAKNWAIFQTKIAESIDNLLETFQPDRYGNEQWLILDDEGARKLREELTSKSYIPGTSSHDPTNDTRQQRPPITFLQRDGYLFINNTDISNYGLYYCFDKESREIINFVYYLIPITPILVRENFATALDECGIEAWGHDVWRLDGFNQYRFYPRLLVNSNRSSTQCENNKCDKYRFDEAKLETNPVSLVIPQTMDPEITTKKFNLEVFLHWSPWTGCSHNRTQRTRKGFCHIRKTDPTRVFDPRFDNTFQIYTWLATIHKLLENVDEFRQNGIMLFSGVLGGLLLDDKEIPQHCTVFKMRNWNELQAGIIDPLLSKAVKATRNEDFEEVNLFASPCFRMLQYASSGKKLMFGHSVFQNEKCE